MSARVGELVQIGHGERRWLVAELDRATDRAVLARWGGAEPLQTTVDIDRLRTPEELVVLQRDAARQVLLDIQQLHHGRETVSPYNPRNKETRCVECQKVHPCPSWLAVEQLKEKA